MNMKSFVERWEEFEQIDYRSIPQTFHKRQDLNVFLMLASLIDEHVDIVSAAEHDQIWLNVGLDELNKVITDEQIKELVSCNVMLEDKCCLSMFV